MMAMASPMPSAAFPCKGHPCPRLYLSRRVQVVCKGSLSLPLTNNMHLKPQMP